MIFSKWPTVTIGEAFKTSSGGTPNKSHKEYFLSGQIPWLMSGEVNQREIRHAEKFITEEGLANCSARWLPENSVLIAMYGATAGQVGVLKFPATTNQAVCALHPNNDFEPVFVYYALLVQQADLIAKAVGNAQPNLSQLKIKKVRLPKPPLSEQRRIVSVLDAAFAGLATAEANTRQNLTNARELFDSYLDLLFKQNDERWIENTLETLTAKNTPITYGVVKPGPEGSVPFVRGGDVKDGAIDVSNLRTITTEYSDQYRRTLLRGGELVVCLVGQPGQVGIVPMELAGANIARQVGLVRLNSDVDTRFVCYFLRSPSGKKELGLYEGGSVQQVINLRDLKRVRVATPDLSTQQKVVTSCETLEMKCTTLIANATEKLAALQELKQSLLHRAFRGELSGGASLHGAVDQLAEAPA